MKTGSKGQHYTGHHLGPTFFNPALVCFEFGLIGPILACVRRDCV